MSDPSTPPRPSLRQSVYEYLAACVWDSQQSRVETSGGTPVYGWLNQDGSAGQSATVEWEAGTSTDLGAAVPAAVPYATWNIIDQGTFDSQTGRVTYSGTSYTFVFKMKSGVATMVAEA